jgi:hypothetical protein
MGRRVLTSATGEVEGDDLRWIQPRFAFQLLDLAPPPRV